jgi:hypothetical protein
MARVHETQRKTTVDISQVTCKTMMIKIEIKSNSNYLRYFTEHIVSVLKNTVRVQFRLKKLKSFDRTTQKKIETSSCTNSPQDPQKFACTPLGKKDYAKDSSQTGNTKQEGTM